MNKDFSVSMSPFFKITTFLLIALLILIGLTMTYNEPSLIPNLIYWGTILPIITGCYLFSLNKVKVDFKNIYIISKIKTTVIPINKVKNITRKSKSNYLMIIGARGIYGLIGRSLDNYKCNIKNTSKLIAIELKEEKFLISCDHPDEFINTINTLKNVQKTS